MSSPVRRTKPHFGFCTTTPEPVSPYFCVLTHQGTRVGERSGVGGPRRQRPLHPFLSIGVQCPLGQQQEANTCAWLLLQMFSDYVNFTKLGMT